MKFTYRIYIIGSLLITFATCTYANVKLPVLISDNMVLQREAKVKIWGWAAPGERVYVSFAGKKYHTNTGAEGKWLIVMDAMPAGGPFTMNISGANSITVKNILIGDVWFCSGQSNMVIPMERVKEKYPDEIAAADFPQIRNFFIPTLADVTRQHADLPPGKWMAASPANVLGFGAVSYFFAQQLYRKYHVPIGIINASVGGTPIEAWISESGLKQFPESQQAISNFKDTTYTNKHFSTPPVTPATQQPAPDKGLSGPKTWYDISYEPKFWHKFWLPGYWADQGIKNLNGTVWFRKEIDLPTAMAGQTGKIFMGRIVDADQTYINGVLVGKTTYQYPPRRYEIPAGLLKPGKNIIVVKVVNTAGKGGFVPDKPYYITANGQNIDLRGDWLYSVGRVDLPADNNANVIAMQNSPTGLYNTMVAPATAYTLKGMVWYQGEANTNKPKEYQQLLPALIADWRNKWGQGNLPFLYVQLPNFMEVNYSPSESNWAELRSSQLKALQMPNTAMVVTIDAGEWNDIHPLNKKVIGDRLALAAQHFAYGDHKTEYSGPIYKSVKIDGRKMILTFSHIGSGLELRDGEGLPYFAIAGADKKYVWAKVSIKGDEVIVWNETVAHPAYVRYAWADNPEGANLYNKDGLPASPFETGD